MDQLQILEEESEVGAHHDAAPARFRHLIRTLHQRTGRPVAILVDEYDKPILDALDAPEVARANRDFLRGLYAVVKDCDAHIRFSFITGVSKFSKVSLFSGLNNLKDITLNPRYSAICGYTEADLDSVFAPGARRPGPGPGPGLVQRLRLAGRGQGLQPVRHPAAVRYARVRGPLVRDRHAHLSGGHVVQTPGELAGAGRHAEQHRAAVDVRRRRHADRGAAVPDRLPDHCAPGAAGRADVLPAGVSEPGGAAEPEPEPAEPDDRGCIAAGGAQRAALRPAAGNDFTGLAALVESFFASIPYEWYTNNDIASYEGFYASVFYSYFAGLGLDVVWRTAAATAGWTWWCVSTTTSTCSSSRWWSWRPRRGDGAVESAGLRGQVPRSGEPIHLIGVEFSRRPATWLHSTSSRLDQVTAVAAQAHPAGRDQRASGGAGGAMGRCWPPGRPGSGGRLAVAAAAGSMARRPPAEARPPRCWRRCGTAANHPLRARGRG